MAKCTTPTISIIIPVYMGGAHFEHCLQSVVSTTPQPMEIIVVADGEGDGSWRCAERHGIQVYKAPTNGGPARARNLGASVAAGGIFLFIDADILVPREIVGEIATLFEKNPGMAAAFGSYDDSPGEPNFLSQYKNLFHHFVHQTGREDASTFWAGCGAVRREAFLKLGGFNETYRKPCIEDIELGYRLKRAGYTIKLAKDVQVKHMKRWDVVSLIKTDFFYRALPWTELIRREGAFINDLNLKVSSRLSVVLVYLLMIGLAGAAGEPRLLISTPFVTILLMWLNWDLYCFFSRKRGLIFTLAAIPWHWLYFFYSGLAFVIGCFGARLRRSTLDARARG